MAANITLTATLLDYSGVAIGTATQPAKLRIALCGYGQTLPKVAGVGNLAKVVSWPGDIVFTGAQISVQLYGNDQISPSGTFYEIAVLDTQGSVVQSGIYQFTGTQTIDLSNAAQIVAPAPAVTMQQVKVTATGPLSTLTLPSTPRLTTQVQIFVATSGSTVLSLLLDTQFVVTGNTIIFSPSLPSGEIVRVYYWQ